LSLEAFQLRVTWVSCSLLTERLVGVEGAWVSAGVPPIQKSVASLLAKLPPLASTVPPWLRE